MMLWGIWQGKGKPPFNAFFEPFTSQMNQLYKEGKCACKWPQWFFVEKY